MLKQNLRYIPTRREWKGEIKPRIETESVCVELFILDSNQTGGGRVPLQNVMVDPKI